MKVTTTTLDLEHVRALVTRPVGHGAWPTVLACCDIFQHTPSHQRLAARLAGHGFAVISPEIYSRFEGRGAAFDFDADRQRALDASAKVDVADLDADLRAVLDHVGSTQGGGATFAIGWCFGGHVALRAALDPRVKAAACCYATGVHDGRLGKRPADTLARAGEIRGDVLFVWGRNDPHIPAAGRAKVHASLEAAGARVEARHFDAEHAFMRDVGERFDAEATDRAFDAVLQLFRVRA